MELVEEETERLRGQWSGKDTHRSQGADLSEVLTADRIESLDLFDRVQLEALVEVCRQAKSLSAAGRRVSRRPAKQKSRQTTPIGSVSILLASV